MEQAIRILALDDNPYAIRLIREILSDVPHLEFDLCHEQRLDAALATLRTTDFDIILLDLSLPDSFGLDTFSETHKAAPHTPVVILTNSDDDSLAAEAVGLGAQDYLVKNELDGRLLARSIRYAIQRQQAAKELNRLQKAVAEMSLREQRRIGMQLHDGLGQHLTGLAYMGKSLHEALKREDSPHSEEAGEVARLIVVAQHQIRGIVKGLHPVDVDAAGLNIALMQLTRSISKMCGVKCTFESEEQVLINDNTAATELFQIAQEAINNALKHAKAERIEIRLDRTDHGVLLSIADDGEGLSGPLSEIRGMGTQIMKYRAGTIGASLDIHPSPSGGVQVSCTLTPEKSTEHVTS